MASRKWSVWMCSWALPVVLGQGCSWQQEALYPTPAMPEHPEHVPPAQRGTAFVGRARPVAPRLEVQLMAFRVADDDGGRAAPVEAADIQRWVAFANDVYRPAGIYFRFEPRDLRSLRSTLLNDMMGSGPSWREAKWAADAVAARHPDHLVLFFRHGPGGGTSGGFAWTDFNFVVMPGWAVATHCGHDHVDALAHELGHHLGLWHTFARPFAVPEQAAAFSRERGGGVAAFDGDGLGDTAPDPAVFSTECVAVRELRLAGLRVPLARRNVMSYYDERDSLSETQIRRARWFLELRRGHRMRLPKNRPSAALEGEALRVLSSSGQCVAQPMGDFGSGNWSQEQQLFCPSRGPQSVTVLLPVNQAGPRRLVLYTTRAPDFGIVEVFLDGQPLGAAFDTWGLSVLASGGVPLGQLHLSAGQHELTFVVRRKNSASTGYHLGIDAIALEPAG